MTDSGRPAVQLRGVSKSFGKGEAHTRVLHGVDLDIYFGEILLLVGPSGSGKTTLMTILAGMLEADEGSVEVFGRSIGHLGEDERTAFRRENLGFVFQQFNLVQTLSVRENVMIPLLIKGVDRKTAAIRATKMLTDLELGHRLTWRPTSLSGGEQQRVAIARALLVDPKMLICDEPTASLDGETGKKVMEILAQRARGSGRCVVVVTHDNRVFSYGDRIAHIDDGRIGTIEVKKQGS